MAFGLLSAQEQALPDDLVPVEECAHPRPVFLAIQRIEGIEPFALYNCPDCGTTMSEATLCLVKRAQRVRGRVSRLRRRRVGENGPTLEFAS